VNLIPPVPALQLTASLQSWSPALKWAGKKSRFHEPPGTPARIQPAIGFKPLNYLQVPHQPSGSPAMQLHCNLNPSLTFPKERRDENKRIIYFL